jgi:glycine cleavage system H protein
MTVILFITTLIVFLAIDYLLHRREQRAEAMQPGIQRSAPPWLGIPDGIRLATNHLWTRVERDGLVTCGVDGFLARVIGSPSSIAVPEKGASISPQAKSIAMERDGKRIELQIPLWGDVVDANPEVQAAPHLVTEDPYGRGWLLRLRGTPEQAGPHVVAHPASWLREQMQDAITFLLSRLPEPQMATIQDGGMMIEGSLGDFDVDVWKEFNAQFVSLRDDQSLSSPEREG